MPKTCNLSELTSFPTRPINHFRFIKELKKDSDSGAKIDYEAFAEKVFIIYKNGLYSSIFKPLRKEFL